MTSDLRLGRIAGIEVSVNWSVLVLVVLLVWTLANGIFPSTNPHLSARAHLAMAIVATAGFLCALLLHELGHALQARRNGVEIDGITLWMFGGVSRFKGSYGSAGVEFRVALAGPLVSALLGVLAVLVARTNVPGGRRRRRLARLHQPEPVRLQHAAGTAARRRPHPPRDPVEDQGPRDGGDADRGGRGARLRLPLHYRRTLPARLPGLVRRRLACLRKLVPAPGCDCRVALRAHASGPGGATGA